MPAHCVARRVCVLLWVCSSLRVCAVAVCYSPQRPGLVLRPLMALERRAPADREPALMWAHPRQHTREEEALCVLRLLIFKYKAKSDSQCDSLLLSLPNHTLHFLKVHCVIFCERVYEKYFSCSQMCFTGSLCTRQSQQY